ncbi:MAG: DNA polymerase III subunit alpha [Bacteroidales bacterium]|nr:DNA polymerase III subunit alpha [Bacteroidales bacterium]
MFYLNCHSYYSLRYGTMPVEKLVAEARKNDVTAMALTDINNSMGMMDFISECRITGIKPVAGIEFRDGKNNLLFIAIAVSNEGFREINAFLTRHNMEKSPLPPRAPAFDHVLVIYPFQNSISLKPAGNEFIGIRPDEINRLVTSRYRYFQQHLVALLPVTFADENEYPLHRHLRAIGNNTLLSKLTPGDLASPKEKFIPPDFVSILYSDHPQILKNTKRILEECSIDIDFNTVKNKRTFTGSRYDDRLLLEKLASDGLGYRYGKSDKEALKRVKHEIEVIDRLGFSAYFLIAWDIVRYSMSRGFYHVGRGSGANSIVAYCLKITDVDPIELDLYFERFINPKRTSPPDFDIDYSWKDRDEVQDYIFKRYGEKHTALLGTVTTFRDRSIFRELGKVYGLPKEEIDRIVENPAASLQQDGITEQLQQTGNQLMDFPNIRSIHAGGILISEEPVTSYTALDLPPKGLPTTQFDMYVAEAIGFEKLDILSQRGIGHINESVEIIRKNRGIRVDVHRMSEFKKDAGINERLVRGEATGCFYIESPAMRGLLKKLRCNNYLSLVAASSIIRPGVAKSGMMREYIKRFHNPKGFTYLHPIMEEQLKETYGVMVYQEDVIKICHHFAGLDLSDADILRRAMAGRFRSKKEFGRIQDRFFSNCRKRGYPDELTAEVWRQVASFAGYAFSKAHSASYAVESYQSLYLKTYFPQEFMVAVINNFGGFYHTWVYFNEARLSGASIHLPCVNKSDYMTSISGSDVYIGLVHIANLEERTSEIILQERERNGPYSGMEDFIRRVPVGTEQLVILIRLDAFRFTHKTKKQLLWEAHLLSGNKSNHDRNPMLFCEKTREFKLPDLEQGRLEDAYDEIELLGFPVTLTRFDLLETSFRGEIFARDLIRHVGKKIRILGDLVTIKYVHTVRREWMHFGCFLDVHGKFFDTVNFPDSLRQYPFRGYGVYLILGTVTEEFGFPSITVEKMAKLPFKKDPRY